MVEIYFTVLTGVAMAMALCGLDDLLVDCLYHLRRTWRSLTIYRRHPRARAESLIGQREPAAAILVPAWSEGAVIAAMLRHLRQALLYRHYRVFVGCYSNDFGTQAAVRSVAGTDETWLALVYCERPGPTSKADCLNCLFRAARPWRPAFYVLQDAEDVVHPLSLSIMARLIGRADMVQLPVIALERPVYDLVGGHYLDEFAEAHAKELVVREALAGHVPSAGVGCAFAADALEHLADARGGAPFHPGALTEDYEVALALHRMGARSILARVPAADGAGPVATREYFPSSLTGAVRQKARWYLGIVFQGWRQLRWSGSWRTRYALARDRKAPFAALLTLAGYGLFLAGLSGSMPVLQRPLLRWLLLINLTFLAWRLVHRAAFTGQLYGPVQAIVAIPRALISNLVNALAALRALALLIRAAAFKQALSWDKTPHRFPSDKALAPFRARLGTRLCREGLISLTQLDQALAEQKQRPERLGDILVAHGWIDRGVLERAAGG